MTIQGSTVRHSERAEEETSKASTKSASELGDDSVVESSTHREKPFQRKLEKKKMKYE
jgi:hypothetical protein